MAATLTILEVSKLLGVSKNTAYEQARSGEIAGVPVLHVGHRLLILRARLLAVLGIEPEESADRGAA